MIEQVKEIEDQAASIRQEAVVKSREMQAAVQQEVQDQKAKDAEAERVALRAALQQAEADGEALAKKILEKREQEADSACAVAERKIGEAVDYLIRRVVSNL